MAVRAQRDLQISRICFAATLVLIVGALGYLAQEAYGAYLSHHDELLHKLGWLTLATGFLIYGNLLYQTCIMGHFKRQLSQRDATVDELQSLYDAELPTLSVLIPAYKEEASVVWQTMMASALMDYGARDIVLLIDDPYQPKTLEDSLRLEAARQLPFTLQAMFDGMHATYQSAFSEFTVRRSTAPLDVMAESERLAALYEGVVHWIEQRKFEFLAGRAVDALHHADRFFHDSVLEQTLNEYRSQAEALHHSEAIDHDVLSRHYRRLSTLFAVRFSSFERKKYVHLSHEANKAMNLNGYLSVSGKHWVEEERPDGWYLREVPAQQATFQPPACTYHIIIDADTILLHDYALRLIHEMEKPDFAHIGVMQCYPSAFPNIPMGIERLAGATINLLFPVNQGHEHLGGSFWMGANAVVRRSALNAIARAALSEGKPVTIYIQDGTVIEDTETTLALLHKGWRVHQYPKRLAFFSTPPDFGSLLIQRRRWANGGILLLPSLIRYVMRTPKSLALIKELFVRFDYLTWGPVGCVMGLLMACVTFGDLMHSPWLLLYPLPCLIVQLRILKMEGYRYSDAPRLMALGVMLGPVIMGGVLKSLQQAITGRKIPFARTPKIPERTSAPALYALIELALPILMFYLTYRYILTGSWAQASFTLINGVAAMYALIFLMGIRPTFVDVVAGMRARVRTLFHRAEIIPMRVRDALPEHNNEVHYGG
ncbi:MAG: hypothetical protein K2Q12_07450 [Rickettsiales bacterium]|nr:hypothetical protein [Rickettsiales bacterium]